MRLLPPPRGLDQDIPHGIVRGWQLRYASVREYDPEDSVVLWQPAASVHTHTCRIGLGRRIVVSLRGAWLVYYLPTALLCSSPGALA